jgi:hypothetical protein
MVFTQDGLTVPYDVVSFNTGSYVPTAIADGSAPGIVAAEPIEKLRVAQQRHRHPLQKRSAAERAAGLLDQGHYRPALDAQVSSIGRLTGS